MHVTPVAAWWLRSGGKVSDETQPGNGWFLILELKLDAEVPTTFPGPLTGDGPQVISGGQEWNSGGDSASDNAVWNTCLPGLSSASLPVGQSILWGDTFDVPSTTATLRWVDPESDTITWRIPAASTGPLPANVRGAIASGNGC